MLTDIDSTDSDNTDDPLFAALADPTRRRVFERVCAEPRPVGRLAAGLPVSRPAVSQHLKVLKDAGLVTEERRGTRRIYAARADALDVLRAWLDHRWGEVLARFKTAAEAAPGSDPDA